MVVRESAQVGTRVRVGAFAKKKKGTGAARTPEIIEKCGVFAFVTRSKGAEGPTFAVSKPCDRNGTHGMRPEAKLADCLDSDSGCSVVVTSCGRDRVRVDRRAAIRDHFAMLFESAHLRVTCEFGTATLWLGFPGEPVNALDSMRLQELDDAIAAIERNPFVNIVVVRSAKPAGYCAGIHPDAYLPTASDRAAFSWLGQRVFARLANLAATTVAFIEGPCLGAGLELALACDHRLCLSKLTTHLGFTGPTSFGGTPRLKQRLGHRVAKSFLESDRTLSGREAQKLGLVDRAFCERRAKIELRTFLDELEIQERQPRRNRELFGFAEERLVFAHSKHESCERTSGVNVDGLTGIAVALARGFLTPLEAEQARERLKAARTPREVASAIRELVGV